MRVTTLLKLAVASAVLLPLAGPAVAAPAGPRALKDYPRPATSGATLAAGVARFGDAFPLRVTATPAQLQAAQSLQAELAAVKGLTVTTKTYRGVLQAVIATKRGSTRPSEEIVFGAHLDSMVGTASGHYDNATGARTVVELAKAFAKVKTHRTLTFALYNGEEQGALASEQMAADYQARKVRTRAYLGFDMVGIAWPVGGATSDQNCLCLWRGARDEGFDKVFADVNYGFLKLPRGKRAVSIEGVNVRNSDEASWADAGFPTLRWAGMRKAADYPAYHLPGDTMATIDATAGGRRFLEAGLRNTLLSAYYTAAALDLQR